MKVIPRDLFNDGNLLNNYGNLYIQLELHNLHNLLTNHSYEFGDNNFIIETNKLTGSTYLLNVELYTKSGTLVNLYRNLNSRSTHSLWFNLLDDDYKVFNDDGTLSTKLLNHLQEN